MLKKLLPVLIFVVGLDILIIKLDGQVISTNNQNPNPTVTSITMNSTLFANLGTPANGILVYCPDCTIANPCAGSGTGALAKRLNGVWVCN